MWETRFILGRLASTQSSVKQLMLLIGDVIASVSIYLISILIYFVFLKIVIEFSW